MVFIKKSPIDINWKKQLAKVKLDGEIIDVPIAYTGTSILNKKQANLFDILLIGDTLDNVVGILIYKSIND